MTVPAYKKAPFHNDNFVQAAMARFEHILVNWTIHTDPASVMATEVFALVSHYNDKMQVLNARVSALEAASNTAPAEQPPAPDAPDAPGAPDASTAALIG